MITTNLVDQSPDAASRIQSDETMWAMLCHLGGLFGAVLPPGNIIAPLVIWLIFRDKYPLVDDQGKEAVNFQISLSIYLISAAILLLIAVGFFLIIALLIFALIVIITAALRARDGEKYRYPLAIRFIR